MLKVKDFKETQELINNGTLQNLKWRIYWNKDNNRIEVYETTNNGIRHVISSRQLQKKPTWIEWTIETAGEAKIICCTAHRDEKKLSLPRHTRQLSRKNQLGDTNSATAYKRNTKRMGGTDRCERNKREADKTPRKGAKNV